MGHLKPWSLHEVTADWAHSILNLFNPGIRPPHTGCTHDVCRTHLSWAHRKRAKRQVYGTVEYFLPAISIRLADVCQALFFFQSTLHFLRPPEVVLLLVTFSDLFPPCENVMSKKNPNLHVIHEGFDNAKLGITIPRATTFTIGTSEPEE